MAVFSKHILVADMGSFINRFSLPFGVDNIGGLVNKVRYEQNGKLFFVWKMVNCALYLVIVIVILYHTIFRRSSGVAHTMPFIRTIEQIMDEPDLLKEMIMNAFLFFPFGLTMPYAIGSNKITENNRKKYLPVLITIVTAFLLSISIELIQYLYNFGNAELSDILMNTLGAAIGTVSYGISQKLLN